MDDVGLMQNARPPELKPLFAPDDHPVRRRKSRPARRREAPLVQVATPFGWEYDGHGPHACPQPRRTGPMIDSEMRRFRAGPETDAIENP
jgi:hypothetical protein